MTKGTNSSTETKPSDMNSQPAQEAMYSVEELMSASRLRFGVSPEVVSAALKFYGATKTTATEAKRLIEKFKKREVK